MSSQLNNASLALSITSKYDGYYIKKNFKTDRVEDNALSPDEVIVELQKAIIQAMHEVPADSYRTYDKLRMAVMNYDSKYHPSQPLVRRTEVLISFLFFNAFSMHKSQQKEARQEAYLTGGLEVTSKPDLEMTRHQCFDQLLNCLKEYFTAPALSGGPLLPVSAFNTWQYGIGLFLSGNDVAGQTSWQAALVDFFTVMINKKEQLDASLESKRRGIQHNENIISIEQFLERLERKRARIIPEDLEVLRRCLTTLSVEQLFLQELIFTLFLIPIMAGIGRDYVETAYTSDEVAEDNDTSSKILLSRQVVGDESLSALGLRLEVVKACKKIVRHGVDMSIQPLLRKLCQLQGTELDATATELIKMLEYNEFYGELKKKCHVIPPVAVALHSMSQQAQNKDMLYSREDGDCAFRLQGFLSSIGFALSKAIDETKELSFQERYTQLNAISDVINTAFRSVPLEIWRDKRQPLYARIYKALQDIASRVKGSSRALINCHKVVIALEGVDSDNSQPLKPAPISLGKVSEFEKFELVIAKGWTQPLISRVSYLIHEIQQEMSEPKAAEVVQAMPKNKRKEKAIATPSVIKKHVAPSDAQSKVESPEGDAVAQKIQLLLVEAPSEPVEDRFFRSAFRYHNRVTRWFADRDSEQDPFKCDSSYKSITNPHKVLWQRVKHGFALAVDQYVQYGIFNTNQAELKNKQLASQVQLVGQITLELGNFREQKRGVFSYSTSAHTKECFHRHFTTLPSERIQSEYTQNGHWKIDFPPFEGAAKLSGKRVKTDANASSADQGLLLNDGSHVVSDNGGLVTIKDPRNHATIVLVKI